MNTAKRNRLTITVVPDRQSDNICAVGSKRDGKKKTAVSSELFFGAAENVVPEILQAVPAQVRVVGHPSCASAIAGLFAAIHNEQLPIRLLIGSPAELVRTTSSNHTGAGPLASAARSSRLNTLPGSIGGWHTATETDFISYMICAAIQREDELSASELLTRHPAYAAFSFLHGFSALHAARVVAHIRDPRWFTDADNPDRQTRLNMFLGVTGRIMSGVLAGNAAGTVREQRANDVLDSFGGRDMLNGHTALSNVRPFIAVRFATAKKGPVDAALRITKIAMSFVRRVWLAADYAHDSLFVPEYFFVNAAEARDFRRHISELSRNNHARADSQDQIHEAVSGEC